MKSKQHHIESHHRLREGATRFRGSVDIQQRHAHEDHELETLNAHRSTFNVQRLTNRSRGSLKGVIQNLFFVAAGILVLAGCTSNPAKVDRGSIAARSFSFVNPATAPAPRWQPIHTMIQDAITTNLAQRGIAKADGRSDVTVGYLLIVGNNAATASLNDYFPLGEDPDKLQNKALGAYSKSKNPSYFEAGTLVIDLIDSQSFKLLKRGYATRPVLRNPSADARMANIQEAVDEILRDLRVAP